MGPDVAGVDSSGGQAVVHLGRKLPPLKRPWGPELKVGTTTWAAGKSAEPCSTAPGASVCLSLGLLISGMESMPHSDSLWSGWWGLRTEKSQSVLSRSAWPGEGPRPVRAALRSTAQP